MARQRRAGGVVKPAALPPVKVLLLTAWGRAGRELLLTRVVVRVVYSLMEHSERSGSERPGRGGQTA